MILLTQFIQVYNWFVNSHMRTFCVCIISLYSMSIMQSLHCTGIEGGIPLDGTPVARTNTFYLALVITYYSFAALGIVFSTVCLVFNFTQRKKKYGV